MRPAIGRATPQFWVCADKAEADALVDELQKASARCVHEQEAGTLIDELQKTSALLHVFVFTDFKDEMQLGSGRHRIDQ